jgi:DNA polymerase-3 subunit delta'
MHPNSNLQLVLHNDTLERLITLTDDNKLPHALLITGAKGIGKATLAYHFVRHLLNSPSEDADNNFFGEPEIASITEDSPVYTKIIAGAHPDLLVIEPAYDERKKAYKNEITVDAMREVTHFLSHTAAETNWRIILIDSIDQLNRNAANAVLKLLEEPPSNSLFILISHQPATLLPTISSRCHAIHLRPPNKEQFIEILRLSHPDANYQVIEALYTLSGGLTGIANDLLAHEGLALYQKIITLMHAFIDQQHSEKQHCIESISSKENEAAWPLFVLLLPFMIERIIRFQHQTLSEIDSNEIPLLQQANTTKPSDYWLAFHEKAITILPGISRMHLDKKHALQQLFS